MEGFLPLVDVVATCYLFWHAQFKYKLLPDGDAQTFVATPKFRGRLRTIQSGALRIGTRLQHALNLSPACLFCAALVCTREHLFWQCPSPPVLEVREALLPQIRKLASHVHHVDLWAYKPFLNCGVIPEDPLLNQFDAACPEAQIFPDEVASTPEMYLLELWRTD